ncbi:Uu.00g130240.m01.CDS01 [Anthostomella pinea]|uniref:Uu.00g130240.m01.CDS01 n=1 Tax=Anthostomella pinea TaxID=933095 RepID=A0AAI8VIN4_9PEZI|nr:Uu.00g130240.m01.CDS01 [Anthostomella pinea]
MAPFGLCALLLALAISIRPILTHSWVEQLVRIAPNGTMIAPAGYIRGYVGRTEPGFNDAENTYLLPPNGRPDGKVVHSDDRICKATQQIGNYSEDYPMLHVARGDLVALRYQENGHVTLTKSNANVKPDKSGIVYVYGTANPLASDTLLGIHQVWTADGQGGDRRGRLLATRNFDDGQCYQINDTPISKSRQIQASKEAEDPQGADLWCQSDIRLPCDLPRAGTYTLYWVWDWPTLAPETNNQSAVVSPEIYTSCMDINLDDFSQSADQNVNFIHEQDANSRVIYEQLDNNFI